MVRSLIPLERIQQRIIRLRGQKVMLDSDLAELYGVETKRLNEQVKRNKARFPADFMFRLTKHEVDALNRSHFAIGAHRDPRFLPYAFTEHGAFMAANILHSPRATEMSIRLVRTFAKIRQLLATHADLARKLASLEKKYDSKFKLVFAAIRCLMVPPKEEERN